MIVYVESNFVLELALEQEESLVCEELLARAERKEIRLVVPAWALAEPFETLGRRRKERAALRERLGTELKQLRRTRAYEQRTMQGADLETLLAVAADEDRRRFDDVQQRLLGNCEVIPLTATVLRESGQLERRHDLTPQDAIVLASVLAHDGANEESVFINRNSRDFDVPLVRDALKARRISLVTSFGKGLGATSGRGDAP